MQYVVDTTSRCLHASLLRENNVFLLDSGFVYFWKALGSHSKYVYKKSRTGKVQVPVWIQPQQTEAETVPDV